jgi:cyclohexa-1,5-dienecarbonyl-CoA hydratase
MTDSNPVTVERLHDGALWHVVLDRPKANVIDAAMTNALAATVREAAAAPGTKALLFEGAGKHFSFGASVEEHQPDRVTDMLATFHGLFRTMADSGLVLLAAVRGQCLGGGLELAAFCHRVFASPDARLGQPEIRLGVFAPVASVILRERMGAGAAEELCLTGRVLAADEGLGTGLVDVVADDPKDAAQAWFAENLAPHSASSLRFAARAARAGMHERFFADLRVVERLYLDELMKTEDAVEGIRAFLEKRPPAWRNR